MENLSKKKKFIKHLEILKKKRNKIKVNLKRKNKNKNIILFVPEVQN